MNIVYLIIHIPRFLDKDPPYFYIGSKYKWKGHGTYYSSSRHSILKNAYKEDLILGILWQSEDCCKEVLLEMEKSFQLKYDSYNRPEYFNLNIANTNLYKPESIEKRIESFKETARRLSDEGIPNKEVWSKKSLASRCIKDANGVSANDRLAVAGKKRMLAVQKDGKTYAKQMAERMLKTKDKVGEDGLNIHQRTGKTLSGSLRKILPSGKTVAKERAEKSSYSTKIRIFDLDFPSKSDAGKFLKMNKTTINNILAGKVKKKTYLRLCELFGEDCVSKYVRKYNQRDIPVVICGQTFNSYTEAQEVLKISEWTFNIFIRDHTISKTMEKALINYFGKNTYSQYYSQNIVFA